MPPLAAVAAAGVLLERASVLRLFYVQGFLQRAGVEYTQREELMTPKQRWALNTVLLAIASAVVTAPIWVSLGLSGVLFAAATLAWGLAIILLPLFAIAAAMRWNDERKKEKESAC